MRVHEDPAQPIALYLGLAALALAAVVWFSPYDLDAAVERVYAVLKKTNVCTEDEYEASQAARAKERAKERSAR